MKTKIAFVILNYITYWETATCVDSINSYIGKDGIRIIIVDNGSDETNRKELHKIASNNNNVDFLFNEKNLGFASGNNVGIHYAKVEYNPDFVIAINSDIIMNDLDFVNKLYKYYENMPFSIAGPNVKLLNGISLNPVQSSLCCLKDVEKEISYIKRNIWLCEIGIEPVFALFRKLLKRKGSVEKKHIHERIDCCKGYQLHGCFVIFSKQYLEHYLGFVEGTFLYGEETLLRMRCCKQNLTMLYCSEITAIHAESKTEKYISNDLISRHKKRYENLLASREIIKSFLLDNDAFSEDIEYETNSIGSDGNI